MKDIIEGKTLKCIFAEKLPGKSHAPKLTKGAEYTCKSVFFDSGGNPHVDVGLPLDINSITSFATGEELPPTTHWCHPNRFVVIS